MSECFSVLEPVKSLNTIEKIQPRMMVATFNGNLSSTMISCYSLTNASDETDLITFFNELSTFVCSIPKHNILIISDDINAQIGKNKNNSFSRNSSNGNDKHQTDFSMENGRICFNSKFQKRQVKL